MQTEQTIDLTRIAAEEGESVPVWPESFSAVGNSAPDLAKLNMPAK